MTRNDAKALMDVSLHLAKEEIAKRRKLSLLLRDTAYGEHYAITKQLKQSAISWQQHIDAYKNASIYYLKLAEELS